MYMYVHMAYTHVSATQQGDILWHISNNNNNQKKNKVIEFQVSLCGTAISYLLVVGSCYLLTLTTAQVVRGMPH